MAALTKGHALERTPSSYFAFNYFAALSISFHSASVRVMPADAMFSSRCLTEEVPGIGKMTDEWWRSHARESCATVAPCFLAVASSLPPGCAS